MPKNETGVIASPTRQPTPTGAGEAISCFFQRGGLLRFRNLPRTYVRGLLAMAPSPMHTVPRHDPNFQHRPAQAGFLHPLKSVPYSRTEKFQSSSNTSSYANRFSVAYRSMEKNFRARAASALR
jgi:hypothetical protein